MNQSLLSSVLLLSMAAAPGFAAVNGDLAAGKAKAPMCAGCHGANGIGVSAEFPNLAGQKADYLSKQLHAFRDGSRVEPTMKAMASALSDGDIANLAVYFASLERSPVAVVKAAPTASGKPTAREFPHTTFITMKKSGTVETFPDETVWQGGPNMLYDAVTPDGSKLLATSPSSNKVYVFDTASGGQLAAVPVGKAPKGVKVTPDGRFAWVSNQGSGDLSVVDLASLKVIDTIKVEAGPHNARFTRDGKLAYVTLQGGAGLAVVDTAARKMVRVIPIPGITGPHNLDLSQDEKTAFVRDFVHHVAVLDIASGKVRKVITVGNGHGGIDVLPDGRHAVTAAIGDDIVTVIDTQTLETRDIKVGNGPHGVRASSDSRWIYVTLTKDNQVVVIDASTLQVVKRIEVGKFPFWVALPGNP